jgi:hypothetical protein
VATLYVTEYAAAPDGAPQEPALAEQTVAIAAGSAATTNPFAEGTAFVRLHTDAICSVKFGVNPTATAANARMAAGESRLVSVQRNLASASRLKVAVITNT